MVFSLSIFVSFCALEVLPEETLLGTGLSVGNSAGRLMGDFHNFLRLFGAPGFEDVLATFLPTNPLIIYSCTLACYIPDKLTHSELQIGLGLLLISPQTITGHLASRIDS